jgi:hypothetical protein
MTGISIYAGNLRSLFELAKPDGLAVWMHGGIARYEAFHGGGNQATLKNSARLYHNGQVLPAAGIRREQQALWLSTCCQLG